MHSAECLLVIALSNITYFIGLWQQKTYMQVAFTHQNTYKIVHLTIAKLSYREPDKTVLKT